MKYVLIILITLVCIITYVSNTKSQEEKEKYATNKKLAESIEIAFLHGMKCQYDNHGVEGPGFQKCEEEMQRLQIHLIYNIRN